MTPCRTTLPFYSDDITRQLSHASTLKLKKKVYQKSGEAFKYYINEKEFNIAFKKEEDAYLDCT